MPPKGSRCAHCEQEFERSVVRERAILRGDKNVRAGPAGVLGALFTVGSMVLVYAAVAADMPAAVGVAFLTTLAAGISRGKEADSYLPHNARKSLARRRTRFLAENTRKRLTA